MTPHSPCLAAGLAPACPPASPTPPIPRRIAVVLAGGRSARFGSAKMALRFDGEPILLWHLRRLSIWADECWVSAAAGAPLPGLYAYRRIFVDEHPFAGPLIAMRQIIRAAPDHARIAFVAGDMPALSAHTLRELERPRAAGVMARHDDGHVEPMPSLWSAHRARPIIEWACAIGMRGPSQLANLPEVQCVPIPDPTAYLNVNRRDDLPAMEQALGVRIEAS